MTELSREQQIREHREALARLQADTGSEPDAAAWPPDGYYLLWHWLTGMVIGTIGASVSLLANVIGAPVFGKPPLELIRVYLTFPMGERALDAEPGILLTVGCLLYLTTGAIYGILFHLVMSAFFSEASTGRKLLVATVIGLGLWAVNFYAILSWLQPLLLGDDWIVSMVPWWVGALTHIAFAWTMLAVGIGWGRFVPYDPPPETTS
ncbi:MAG: hypothetical protein R3336_04955 [Phycisphaeraceae bacterium]|nr:hypothetical protein [Phycisphaeraceae bacterium]